MSNNDLATTIGMVFSSNASPPKRSGSYDSASHELGQFSRRDISIFEWKAMIAARELSEPKKG